MRVAVIGGGQVTDTDAEYETARAVGRLLAERDHEVVCGGRRGVMEAVCRGASEADSQTNTIGILPGSDPNAANEYVETAIATGMGNARNVLVVLNSDAVIAVDGATGTLSELGHALDFARPVVGIDTHDLSKITGFEAVETPEEAVESVERRV
jgi:uncharacterized protein (TIGR00725 family)